MQSKEMKAVEVLKEGGIIIFPTDTAFGIGCRIDNSESVRRLFQIRERPLHQPPPVLVESIAKAKLYAEISDEIKRNILERYWPGAVTVILPVNEGVDPLLQKDNGIGLRVPNNDGLLSVIEKVGVGIVGCSANFHGKPTPYRIEDLDNELIAKVDFVLEGVCTLKKESTVISCLSDEFTIVRQGAVNIKV